MNPSFFGKLVFIFEQSLNGTAGGKFFLISIPLLVIAYFLFRKNKNFFKISIIYYLILFVSYIISLGYYYDGINDWVNITTHFSNIPKVFFGYLDTSLFFILYSLVYVIIIYFRK